MPPHKLTRKELRQDGFVAWTGRAVDFLQDHYLKLAIGVLAVVVVVGGTSLYRQGGTRSPPRLTGTSGSDRRRCARLWKSGRKAIWH